MRKRSGALHCKDLEECLKLVEEQDQHIADIHQSKSKGIHLKHQEQTYDTSQISSECLFTHKLGSASAIDEGETPYNFDENKCSSNRIVNVMLICQFGSRFLSQISSLDSFDTRSTNWCAGKHNDKMLDLVIATENEEQKNLNDPQIVFKIWIHNSLSCRQPSFHNQIIEQIHYSRCQFFIFVYDENESQDILQCYERVKQLKGNQFKEAFIAIKADGSSQQKNIHMECRSGLENFQDNSQHFPQNISHFKIDSQQLSDYLRQILREEYSEQELKGKFSSVLNYQLESKTPVSASTNKTRSSSSESDSNSCNSNNSEDSDGQLNESNSREVIFQNNILSELQESYQKNQEISDSISENLFFNGEIQTNMSKQDQHQDFCESSMQNQTRCNNNYHNYMKGANNVDTMKLVELPECLGLQDQVKVVGKQQRSFSYHCGSFCQKKVKKKNISYDFGHGTEDYLNIQQETISSSIQQSPYEVIFNSPQH